MTRLTPLPPAADGRDPARDLERFRADVLRGLAGPARELPCKYFYDERGSRLFEEICELEEYYLTRTELAIMRRHAAAMAESLGPRCLLIEFGSGSSLKTRLLLDRLHKPAGYVPIDISGTHLAGSARLLAARYPGLEILPVCGDFALPLQLPASAVPPERHVVYFPGSTIGNFGPTEAAPLLGRIRRLCGPGGGFLVGVDLQKDRRMLERAYNDSRGVTAAFNLNILRRINRELHADFRLEDFEHLAFYDERHGRIEMHLVSRARQTVHVGGVAFDFAAGERIRTECSYKHTVEGFQTLVAPAGMELSERWTDENNLFAVLLFRAGH